MNSNPPHVYLFTDGSASANSPAMTGGWGAIVMTRMSSQLLSGVLSPTTISRCELYPVIEGLRYIRDILVPHSPAGMRVLLVSDSEYVVKTIGGLYEAKRNEDLWSAYTRLADDISVQAIYRTRNSHPIMQLADALAYVGNSKFSEYMLSVGEKIDLPSFDILEHYPLEKTSNDEVSV